MGEYGGAKFAKFQILLEKEEMELFLEMLEPFAFYNLSSVIKKGEGIVNPSDFLANYALYIDTLRSGKIPDPSLHRFYFSLGLSKDPLSVKRIELSEGRERLKAAGPLLQLEPHFAHYDALSKKIFAQTKGSGVFTWGLQLSFPQLYRAEGTEKIQKVSKNSPNAEILPLVRQFLRLHTQAATFFIAGQKITSTLRIGKKGRFLFELHPQIKNLDK